MQLSAKLINQFKAELFRVPRCYYQNVYNIKVIRPRTNSSMHFSCRFKHGLNTFIFSLSIQLSYPRPHMRCSVHLLCPRRVFFKEMFRTYHELPQEWVMQYFMKQEKYMNYYKNNRAIPEGVSWRIFHKFAAKDLIQFLNTLEVVGATHD